MAKILHLLNVKERYVCCTAVAKSWRGFKTKIPGLFIDLSDESFQHTKVVSGYSGETMTDVAYKVAIWRCIVPAVV